MSYCARRGPLDNQVAVAFQHKRSLEDSQAGEREIAPVFPRLIRFRFTRLRIFPLLPINLIISQMMTTCYRKRIRPGVIRHEVKDVARPRPKVNHSAKLSLSLPPSCRGLRQLPNSQGHLAAVARLSCRSTSAISFVRRGMNNA